MAWTTPRTWVTGELVTAALMNTHVRDNEDYLYTLASIPLTLKAVVAGESPYTAAGYNVILCNTVGGAITVNLPAVASSAQKWYYIKNLTATAVVTLDGNAGETIEGETTQTLLDGDCALIYCDGAAWWLI